MEGIDIELAEVLTAGDRPHQHFEAGDVARIVPKAIAFVREAPERQLFAIVVFSSILFSTIISSFTRVEASRFHRGYAAEERSGRPSFSAVVRDQQKFGDPGGIVAFKNLRVVRVAKLIAMLFIIQALRAIVVGLGDRLFGF
jgi:hypothetical protein